MKRAAKDRPTLSVRLELATERAFEDIVLDAVDKGFGELGNGARKVLYHHLEKGWLLKREEIPERLERFHEALHGILGDGARIVESLIMKSISSELGVPFETLDELMPGDSTQRFIEWRRAKILRTLITEVENNLGVLTFSDLGEVLTKSQTVDSEELMEAKRSIGSILDDYVRSKVGASMEANTRKFLENELIYLLLKVGVERRYGNGR